MKKMTTFSSYIIRILVYLFFHHYLLEVSCIKLEERGENIVFEEGSQDEVILDCPYDLEENDESGLVIQWKHERASTFYQWIPFNMPTTLEYLTDKLDLEHVASDNDFKKHRAIKLLNPLTDLSGVYTCVVSSVNDEKVHSRKIIAFSPPSELSFNLEVGNDTSLYLTCSAAMMYPEPEVRLTRSFINGNKVPLDDVALVKSSSYHKFNVTAETEFDESALLGDTRFECELLLPETNYKISEVIQYSPIDGTIVKIVKEQKVEDEENEDDVEVEILKSDSEEVINIEINENTQEQPIGQEVRSSAPSLYASWLVSVCIAFLQFYI